MELTYSVYLCKPGLVELYSGPFTESSEAVEECNKAYDCYKKLVRCRIAEARVSIRVYRSTDVDFANAEHICGVM